MIIFWIFVFVMSLIALLKGADWLIAGAEKIGLVIGLKPFIVGAIIVGVGTSLPELISSMVAVLRDVPEVVVGNAVGSNIANMLLIVGIAAVIGRKLVVTKNLIDLDLPLLAITTVLTLGAVWDKQVNVFEALILILAYVIYLLYTIFHKYEPEMDFLPSRETRKKELALMGKEIIAKPKLELKDFLFLALGLLGLSFGAHYLIESVVQLSATLNINPGVIALTAVAVGTSLPELIVSVKAALKKKAEIALGNVFGSNVFNMLIVVGVPGLFKTLPVDQQTYAIGVPTMALATLLFVISGISRRIYKWEGALYLLVYVLFIAKLFNLF